MPNRATAPQGKAISLGTFVLEGATTLLAAAHAGHVLRAALTPWAWRLIAPEAAHVWDPDFRLGDAMAVQFRHYAWAFRIGRANQARGHISAGLGAMTRIWRRQRRLMPQYPVNG